MSSHIDTIIAQDKVSKEKKWNDYFDKIPFFKLPDGYEISIKPPIVMADARFIVKRPNGQTRSVYLDLHCNLGYFDGPHWEVYPDKYGDNSRVALDDMEGLVKLLTEEAE